MDTPSPPGSRPRPPATASTVATVSAPSTPMTATALAAEPVLACEMPSLDVDPATGVDPVLYSGARLPTRFQRKPPHLDRAREYAAHGKSHLAARQTVALLSERHRAREIEQEESFERAAGRDRFRARFVETRLATCGPPTLNTMDVRIARERQRNQQPEKAKNMTTEAETEARVRDAVRRAYGSQELDLKALELVHIPPQVFTTLLLQLGRFITRVNVSRNALREIPEAFVRAFPQAAVLNYKENALDTLPACMDALTGLEELQVECNQLRRLPVRLPATLRRLVAARNRLTTVPHIHALIHLVELDLGHNHLELLPPGMAYLSKLTKLVVSSNRLVSLTLLPRFLIPESKVKPKKKHGNSPEEADSDDSESDDEGDDEATWTRERIELEQKKWRVEMDPLTGGTVYFHVARKRVARVKPKCFRVGHVPPLALGKPAAAAKQRKTHAQWIALFPDGWEATLGGVCINRHGGRGDSSVAGSRPGTTAETSGPPALQSLELVFTHHLTDETFTSCIPPALDKWGELHRLQALHIGGNQLVELPASIGQLVQLKLLDAEHNKLQALPDTFHDMRALETVRLAMNALAWLPPSFCALPALTDLDLKLNRFEALPEEIGALARLRVLDLSSNSLASLPRALLSLKKLTTLKLQGNQTLVTRGVLRPETLASGDIPQVCWHLSHQILVEQDHGGAWPPASKSQIVGVGDEVWSTNHHVHRAFSQAIARAQQTGALDFHWKHLGVAQFPSGFFSSLRGLRELRLSGQALEVVPAAFANVCGALRVLQLRKNRIRVLEHGVFGDVEGNSDEPLPLEELDLEYNELRALPASVGRLTKLRVLRVSNNHLTEDGIPPAFAALTSLEELHAAHNRFSAPPEAFGALVALHTLDLSNNHLATLATMAFAPLQRLRCLRASLNALTDLPEELARAPIEELYLAGNRLAELPATVLLLRGSLRVLRIQSNQISRLPLAFGELDALERVEAEGNPCRSPPPEILRLGIATIRMYLRKRHARVLEIQRLLETVRLPFDGEAFAAPRLGKLLIRDEASVLVEAAHAAPLAFLTEMHLAAFERAVDAYVNGAFYLPPTASARGADLVTRMLLQTQFELAQRHRARVLRDFVKLCALIREKKWLDKVDFRFDLERPWGRLGEPCAVYAVNPRALYDDAPALPSVLSVVRKRVYHGFENEAFDHAEATVRDALEHFVGEYGPVGVAHDDVPFKCGCEELLRYNKRHEPCFRAGWSVVQVVYTAEEAARRVGDEEAIQRALAALRPQVEAFLRTPEGEKRFHKEVKTIKAALRKELKDKKKKLALLRAKHTKQTQQRAKEAKRAVKDKQPKKEMLTVAEVEERAEEEEKYTRLGERLAEATQEYNKGKAQLGQGYVAFLDDVVGLLLQKIGVEVRNHLVQQQRQKAIEFGLRRPWDGPNGRDFEAHKQLVRRRMLGDGSMEREDGGAADASVPEVVESDNSEISDVSFDGYEDLVSTLNAAAANGEDEEDDDDEDEDDDDEEEEQNERARAAALAQLEVSDVSDVSEDDGDGAASGKRADSEDSDL